MLSGAAVLALFLPLFPSRERPAAAVCAWTAEDAGFQGAQKSFLTEYRHNRRIVRSKEIALQKYTENAACKESKKTSLPWRVCVDRSRLHSTDWRKTNKKAKKKKKKKKSAPEGAWVAAFIFRPSALYRDSKGLILLWSKLDRLRATGYPRQFRSYVAININPTDPRYATRYLSSDRFIEILLLSRIRSSEHRACLSVRNYL